MLRRLVAASLLLSLVSSTGCTVVGGYVGGRHARDHNDALAKKGVTPGEAEEEPMSVGGSIATGALLGLVLDVFAVLVLATAAGGSYPHAAVLVGDRGPTSGR